MLVPVPAAQRSITTWEEALQLVRARSTDLRIAYDEVMRAEAQSRSALAAALPQINTVATATHNFITNEGVQIVGGGAGGTPQLVPYTVPSRSFATGSAQLVQPLINVQTWDSIGIAHDQERVARLSVEDLKRTIALNVANALVGVVTAERISELNRVGLRNALERLDLTKRKQTLGAATGLDTARAQSDVESARSSLVTGDESLRQAREALGLALGLPSQIGVAHDVKLDALERDAVAVCRPAPSIEERADVLAAREKLRVGDRGVKNVEYSFLPTLNAQSTVATTTVDTGSAPATTWNIQGVLSFQLFDGGLRYGQLRQARAQADEAALNLEALRRSATIQLEQARRGVDVAEQSRTVAAAARADAAEIDRLTRTAYKEGQGTSLELVVAAAALREAEITLALREFDLVKARVLALLSLANCPW
jgi:outer membrane protein TolC